MEQVIGVIMFYLSIILVFVAIITLALVEHNDRKRLKCMSNHPAGKGLK